MVRIDSWAVCGYVRKSFSSSCEGARLRLSAGTYTMMPVSLMRLVRSESVISGLW
jgi:hypothetical protein